MKSQDVLLMLRLVSLTHSEPAKQEWLTSRLDIPDDWRGWAHSLKMDSPPLSTGEELYSVRALELSTGISKSEISASLRRCIDTGLVREDRKSGRPTVNTRGLHEFISFGLKYVYPAKPGGMTKGIPTASFAPVLAGQLFSAGEHALVWEDPNGSLFGQKVEPLYKSVPHAVRGDAHLYALLALVDSIRLGHERESALAKKLLEKYLGRSEP